ncbi:MAG: DNA/RNA nuclease SfsA [Candidatus Hodarchaeales archaeon]|jgi:sugar fermentation stimulation protein A
MKLEGKIYFAKFKDRPNRFVAKVVLNTSGNTEKIEIVHVPDPGRLIELLTPDADVILRKSSNPKRKTKYSLIGVKTSDIWVNIDSILTNRLFREDFKTLKFFQDYEILKPEFRFRNSRFDFLMWNKITSQKTLVEVKSATLVKNGLALFPDAPTLRGTKHVKDLISAIDEGYQSAIVFISKRSDANCFSANKEIDPKFTIALGKALRKGVQIIAVNCKYDPVEKKELKIFKEIPITHSFNS